LEKKVVELQIVDRASDSTIGRALKKTFAPAAKIESCFKRPRAASNNVGVAISSSIGAKIAAGKQPGMKP
jgi:hypothetical protein